MAESIYLTSFDFGTFKIVISNKNLIDFLLMNQAILGK